MQNSRSVHPGHGLRRTRPEWQRGRRVTATSKEEHDMNSAFQVVFHNIDQSSALTDVVNKRVSKLRRFSNAILGGRVVLDCPHRNHHKGKVYAVSLDIHMPSREVHVKQDQHDKPAHQDLYVAIRDAFNAAERQLKAVDKKQRKSTLSPRDFAIMSAESSETEEEEAAADFFEEAADAGEYRVA